MEMRIGHGYDVHRLTENRKLTLGGVLISHEKGLLGHSDADVLAHAVMDALLGALGLPDIGRRFPDSDEKYAGADSMVLMENVWAEIFTRGYRLGNLDCTIVAEKPKLSPYMDEMRKSIAAVLETDIGNVNVKATTEEGLGLAGNGIGAYAVCLLIKE